MSDHLLHLAARTIGVMPLRPRTRLRFEPVADDPAEGSLDSKGIAFDRGATDREPMEQIVADDRPAAMRREGAVEARHASGHATATAGTGEGSGERSPSRRAADRLEQQGRGSHADAPDAPRSALTVSELAAPRRDEVDATAAARRDIPIGDQRARRDDGAARTSAAATSGASAPASDHDIASAVRSEPAPREATPGVPRRHRLDERAARESTMDALASREQRTASEVRGSADMRAPEAAQGRHLRSERAARAAEPVVHVSIGRIEVRATTPTAPPRAAERRHAPMTIDDYVARGKGR